MPSTVTTQSTLQNLKPLTKTPQFYWFLGHFFAIVFFIWYYLLSFITNTTNFYNYCLNSIILTYLIVIKQSTHGKSIWQSISNYSSLLKDDNVQYLLLLILLRFSSKYPGPISTGLYPFVIFAVFHSLTYAKSYIIPNLTFLNDQSKKNYINLIHNFILQYNEKSLYISSTFEFYLLIPVAINFIKLILFFQWIRQSPLSTLKRIVVYGCIIIFIKLRYNQSKYMKQVIDGYDLRINQLILSNPYLPQQLPQVYQMIRQLIITYIGPIKVPQQLKKKDM